MVKLVWHVNFSGCDGSVVLERTDIYHTWTRIYKKMSIFLIYSFDRFYRQCRAKDKMKDLCRKKENLGHYMPSSVSVDPNMTLFKSHMPSQNIKNRIYV